MSENASALRQRDAAWWHARLQAALVFLLCLTATTIPRLDVTFVFLLGLLSAFYCAGVAKRLAPVLERREAAWFLAVLAALSAYLFLTALWALDPLAALDKAGYFLALVLIVLLTGRAFAHQSAGALDRAARFAVWGMLAGTVIAAFEFTTGHLLMRGTYKLLPVLELNTKTFDVFAVVEGARVRVPDSRLHADPLGVTLRVHSEHLNRNLSLMLLLLWPALFLALRRKADRLRLVKAGVIAAAAVTAVIAGQSQTAMLALAFGALAFAAARAWPRFTHRAAVTAWAVTLALAVPLAAAPYHANWHKADWLFHSARDRIVIWGTTVREMARAPVLGVGIRSTRVLNERMTGNRAETGDGGLTARVGMHTHNHFLQIWFELGALGAALILAAGLGLLQRMRGMAPEVRPYAYAAFAAAAGIAAFGWGLWQSWLLAGYAFAIALMGLVAEYAGRQTAPAAPDGAGG